MRSVIAHTWIVSALLLMATFASRAFIAPESPPLPDFDKRVEAHQAGQGASPEQQAAADLLRARLPGVRVDYCRITGAPKMVACTTGFLTGPGGEGQAVPPGAAAAFAADDPYRVVKGFLQEYQPLYGFGPEALDQARVTRDYVTAHNGMKTVVWEQQVAGVPLFESVFIAHLTRAGELVNVCSQFVPAPAAAAGLAAPPGEPNIPARRAVVFAGRAIGEEIPEEQVAPEPAGLEAAAGNPQKRQAFKGPGLQGRAEVGLIWLPIKKDQLRLCWDIILTSRTHGEMYRVLVDARTGEALLRRCLTENLSNATYNVFTSDSPSPFSPASPTPSTNQPPLVSRALVTWAALNTNASPAGWIDDGVNETRGNNVDAHTDRNNDNLPDLPRPQGSPSRVFNFPMDLAVMDPTNYSQAAVAQLFYLCNWMHDRLYALGFTEGAGNFQINNFGRGGAGNDAVQADAQDGSGVNNANMSTPPDGFAGRMQMFLFTEPRPRRDGSLDAEVVLHEYTHGLSNRRVGGGALISALQTRGMGEGWSDFYALALLSEPADNANGIYACGGYASHLLVPGFLQNYYFGIRRYPYTTDINKNPLTLNDIDPGQADFCFSAAPHSPLFGPCTGSDANEVHNMGEVWCATLWELRANLIQKHGFAAGNQLALQLVTDGMGLSPANPNFLQARDAILQADLVATAGANRMELWRAFAKRGLGYSAFSPASTTTTGVREAFDLPDDLAISPAAGFTGRGPVGGPFEPGLMTFTLTNSGGTPLAWSSINTSPWLEVAPIGGTLNPGGPAALAKVSLGAAANRLPMGIYAATVWFSNMNSQVAQSRSFTLRVGQPDNYTELFDRSTNDLAFQSFTFTPDGSASFYSVCRGTATQFPTDPTGAAPLSMSDDSFVQVTLSGANTVGIYNTRTNVLFIGSNGYVTMNAGETLFQESLDAHFSRPRVSALFDDLDPGSGGAVTYQELSDHVAVTFHGVPEFFVPDHTNSFQIELFFDGRIRLTYLAIKAVDGLAGLSAGTGIPAAFEPSDLSAYGACRPLFVPGSIRALSNGGVTFTLSGTVGSDYEILISNNLATWQVLTAITMTSPETEVVDPDGSQGQRYYRARLIPPPALISLAPGGP